MPFDPQSIDPTAYTDHDALVELARELGLRKNAYPKFIEGGKMNEDKATAQFGALWKGHRIVTALAKFGGADKAIKVLQRIEDRGGLQKLALAYQLLELVNEHPGGIKALAEAMNNEALRALATAFPDAKFAGQTSKPDQSLAEAA